MTPFLPEHEARPIRAADPAAALRPRALYFGGGNPALEVFVLDADAPPPAPALRQAWKERWAGRAAPVLAVALHGDAASLLGPAGESPRLFAMGRAEAERLCARALGEPDRHAALRYLTDALPASQTDTQLPGLRNEGLLTDHVLRTHADTITGAALDAARARGRAARGLEGAALLRALGFEVDRLDTETLVLRAAGQRRAIAVLLRPEEAEEVQAERFRGTSPIAWALDRADRESLPWVVTVQRDRVRLYPQALGIGVGRRGRTETWIECRTDLLRGEHDALLGLVFAAEALVAGGTVERLLDASKRFAAGLAERLRDRIYDRVVPGFSHAIVAARGVAAPDAAELRLTYAMALTLLFRLLFVAYAEDRDLLPYATNDDYRRRALKTAAQELDRPDRPPGTGMRRWTELGSLFAAVRDGDPALGVPAYGGGLFEADPALSPAGAALAAIALPDAAFEPALRALLLDPGRDLSGAGAGPVDFRSLRVREFGTIYEGLLESELALAADDLALRGKGAKAAYAPVKPGEAVRVRKDTVYLHGKSGARKASGSYFTPGFAVEHLLDAALAPALARHVERLRALDETDAAEKFFDLRIADIAMGSGHFLVAAIDRVEQALTAFLVERPLPGVTAELATLRAAAERALGGVAAAPIDDAQLLRRQIALRCIYGIDLNPLAVELARLSVWVHSFVPGLPLALLEAHLVHGNALVGVATVRQLEERFAAEGVGMFAVDAKVLLGPAEDALRRRAKLADTTIGDIARARDALREAAVALGPTRALCDIVVGRQVAPDKVRYQLAHWAEDHGRIQAHPALHAARAALAGLDALHVPIAFPEVFLRADPGFDVLLGNPPWEKVKVETHGFWARHFPGLRGLAPRARESRLERLPAERPDLAAELEAEIGATERLRAVLAADLSAGRSSGDPDLYKAFAARYRLLAAERGGRVGVVLPRSVLSSLGTEGFRRALFADSEGVEVVTLTNRAGWVFAEVEVRLTLALLSFARGAPTPDGIALRGPYGSEAAWRAARERAPFRVGADAVLGWTSSASLPMLPGESSVGVFLQLRAAPRLDARVEGAWRARPDTELHATADKGLMDFAPRSTEGLWPVLKGESFDLWEPDRGPDSVYAWAEPEPVLTMLQASRLRSARSARGSAHAEFAQERLRDATTLACRAPRIAFRDVTRATDTRTVRAALVPGGTFCVHQAPTLVWPRGDALDEAYLLGVLCSVPLDWYARRVVEQHLTYFVLNPFPIPRPPRTDPHWQRAVALAGRLAAPDDRFADWAARVGVAHGPLDPAEKQRMIEELDAVVARLYGLSPAQLAHVFETFHDWGAQHAKAAKWAAQRDRTVALLEALP